ncbi:F-box/kelch-repeat protein At3g13680-like [Raphanus sativus]|uniref:F-box/kelch-repeat protein At3g13680-like n=1 Tax=Raphanus sativus TaxID=3726 RepID=A0A9W3DNI6_RAPSA|nr:F-box/kelch-repeat protein At3g13680-like [Raphanus sativus]
MMMMISDLEEEILRRVPMTSLKAVRSTCKKWNAVTKTWLLGKAAAGEQQQQHQFLTMNGRVYSFQFHLEEYVSVKQVDLLNELEVSKVYHCDGLVLCVAMENSKLVLWNPYLCQTRLIGPRESFNIKDRHAIGYGYDSNSNSNERNHKILRFVDDFSLTFAEDDNSILPERKREVAYEIYDIRSDSWRVLEEVNPEEGSIETHQRGVSVKGNTYFLANRHIGLVGCVTEVQVFLLCFDFTKERFGPRLPLPFDSLDGFNGDIVTLSSFLRGDGDGDDEQLAVRFGGYESGFFEIWVTLTVGPNRASWSKFLRVEPGPYSSYGFNFYASLSGGSFFVDEENKLAVLFELDETKTAHKAFVFGQDGSFKSSVNLGEALILERRSPILTYMLCKAAYPPLVCSYRPSLVQLKHPLVCNSKRKRMPLLSSVKFRKLV